MARERDSDAELIVGIARGERAACTTFYRRHLPALLAFLVRETRDRELAADLVGEVFAAILIAAPRYRAEHPSATPWVLGIARNTLGTSRRRGRVEDQVRARLGFEPIELHDADLERVDALASTGEVEALAAALPDAERNAVHLRVVEDRTYPEIAAELDCSEMVVRKRVSRGLSRLRRQLEER
jgi:RNA polymerase sigma factor (sigma-70 family)